jgi:hypothetical protein
MILVVFAGCATEQNSIVGLWREQEGAGVRMSAEGIAEMECLSDGTIYLKGGSQTREFHWRRDPEKRLVIEAVLNGRTHLVFVTEVKGNQLTLTIV